MKPVKSLLFVFLPFALGYHLSYLFRMINAVIAERLVEDLGFDAAQLGLLTSVYFLTFAIVQLPLGVAIDRFGPHRVQALLLTLAAVGALIFSNAASLVSVLLGRALIGLGVAGALIAGLKIIAERFPRQRLPLVNGAFIALGAAGAITATAPLEWLLSWLAWRQVFLLLGAACVVVALLMLFGSREVNDDSGATGRMRFDMRLIYSDRRFWRLAPVSALCIGSAWALQGLWAAPWLADVALLGRTSIVHHLSAMGMALCAGALLIGVTANAARRYGIGAEALLIAAVCTFVAAEVALICRVPLSTVGLWGVIAGMGGATVLSYALLADLFPLHVAGRANAALNLLHIGSAFTIQLAIGLIVDLWPRDFAGHYPPLAYQTAFACIIVLQVMALAWFLLPYWRVPAIKISSPTRTPRPAIAPRCARLSSSRT